MSETWTPKTEQSETWVGQASAVTRVFSTASFSLARHNGRRVFAVNGQPANGGWTAQSEQSEVWTPV